MIETLIWLIAFGIVLFLSLKSWNGALGSAFERRLPHTSRNSESDRWIWSIGLAVIGATFIVRPVSMLLTLLLLGLIGWIVVKLARWGMSKAKAH
ncbi:hypothetical protein MHM84_14340 [Halomonas sp. McH1-25]|uniref:hypothetical protein n=1 Tax=unclassified Halomonas TaxID=2609666 RepID=UPI001EF40DA5|nr:MULTISPECIES: hypothetical protein [unclassified Halomonas]MCG7600960.1 hypothetical protein [Halomonas sp. McH1-25]MCP1342052.1 hypothetical protein [Halomonas sp. FL8]MCP1359766.1 hypothetical protein [Halomonas sp. BBD45]MCP1367775.1 hypothetical protein [Halomonas sp. BBD48]